jgi:hypothetical protein
MVLTQSPSVPQSQGECHTAPTRDSIEEILGKPVECVRETADVCYRKNDNKIRVHFDSANKTETIFMDDNCLGVAGLVALMNKLVPEDIRGKSLKRPIIINSMNCKARNYVEEYECLYIEYFEGNKCMDCNYGSLNVRWK